MRTLYLTQIVFEPPDTVAVRFFRCKEGQAKWESTLTPFGMHVGEIPKEKLSDMISDAHDSNVRLLEFAEDQGML